MNFKMPNRNPRRGQKGLPTLALCKKVSIPSRRVGDSLLFGWDDARFICFHPLKAGRRQGAPDGFSGGLQCFHPLKAGRRPTPGKSEVSPNTQFPSPQGGSETKGK